GQDVALPRRLDHRTRRAVQRQRLIDDELPGVFAGGQCPAVLALRLQRQRGERLWFRQGGSRGNHERGKRQGVTRTHSRKSEHINYLLFSVRRIREPGEPSSPGWK